MSATKVGPGLLVWGADGIEPGTIEQATKTARLPFVHAHVALMPDAHIGIGATVGSVIATQGAIVPAAVGVDIGCGMIAAPTSLTSQQLPDDLGPLHSMITSAIPAGLGKAHAAPTSENPPWAERDAQPVMVQRSSALWQKATTQWGTLGSGNHFVEVCLDETDKVWIVLHSGSRGVGNEIAKRHIDGAKKVMQRYFIELEDPDLAYFAQGTPEFDEYVHDMLWAQEYARTNREQMMTAALNALGEFLGGPHSFTHGPRVNCHHNYTEPEHHHGRNLWVTRKGAIRARTGDMGIIPGSMATGTYIVEGLGNARSYMSASHGAGRRMSRKQARRELDVEGLTAAMTGKTWNEDPDALLDEDPRAYKPIEDVMEAQSDLVRVVHTLTQILNYKGT
jgi:tRNA-splicing ligase RtcB (3'-phosphate/5'-hydroxy nucleic acid ligase)